MVVTESLVPKLAHDAQICLLSWKPAQASDGRQLVEAAHFLGVRQRGLGGADDCSQIPFQPMACPSAAHSCRMIDAPLPSLSTAPACAFPLRKIPLNGGPPILIFSMFICIRKANTEQTKASIPAAPSQHMPLGKPCIWGFIFWERRPSSLFRMDLAFHVSMLHLHLIFSVDTSLICATDPFTALSYP